MRAGAEEEVPKDKIHLISEYKEELAAVQCSLTPPSSGPGRIQADTIFNNNDSSTATTKLEMTIDLPLSKMKATAMTCNRSRQMIVTRMMKTRTYLCFLRDKMLQK